MLTVYRALISCCSSRNSEARNSFLGWNIFERSRPVDLSSKRACYTMREKKKVELRAEKIRAIRIRVSDSLGTRLGQNVTRLRLTINSFSLCVRYRR